MNPDAIGKGSGEGAPQVTFTIDGVQYEATERRQTAATLLTLAGVDPADHDLAKVIGQGQIEQRYKDADPIQLTPGAVFVTIFTGATPVA